MDQPEQTLTFGEQPGGLTARAGWTWDDSDQDQADEASERLATDEDYEAEARGR